MQLARRGLYTSLSHNLQYFALSICNLQCTRCGPSGILQIKTKSRQWFYCAACETGSKLTGWSNYFSLTLATCNYIFLSHNLQVAMQCSADWKWDWSSWIAARWQQDVKTDRIALCLWPCWLQCRLCGEFGICHISLIYCKGANFEPHLQPM